MIKDDIITEVWLNRDAYAEKHHNDLAEIVADLQMRQKMKAGTIVDRRSLKEGSRQFHTSKARV